MEKLDNLTKLFDEDTFYYKLDIEIKRAMRYKDDLSVLMIKPIFSSQETYTMNLYSALRILGDIVKDTVRAVDIPCRLRGEIAVIFPNTPLNNIGVVLNRVKDKFLKAIQSLNEDLGIRGMAYKMLGFGSDFSSLEGFKRKLEDLEWDTISFDELSSEGEPKESSEEIK